MFGAGNQYKGILGITQKMLAKQEQEQYRANAKVGDPFFKPGGTRIKPEQRTDSASYGNKSVFSPSQNSMVNLFLVIKSADKRVCLTEAILKDLCLWKIYPATVKLHKKM